MGGRVVFLDQAASTVTVSPAVIANDGVESATITVRLVNTDGRPMPGLPVTLSSTGTGNTITQPVGVTNQDGVITGSIVSTGAAIKTISATALGGALTDTASLDVGGASSLVFASAFDNSTGNSSTALRDGTNWTSLNGSNDNCAVIAATGLGFPAAMDNVLHIVTEWNGSGSSSKIPRLTGGLTIPDVGESIFYRWYFRADVPTSVPTWGSPHPIQDGPDGGNFNWELETRRGTGGTVFSPMWTLANNAFPNNRWAALDALDVGSTYRFELQLFRKSTTTYQLNARVYDTDDTTLLLSNADFINQTGVGSTSLADNPEFTFGDINQLANFQCGTNGAFQGTVSGDHPVTFCYQSGFAVSATSWCGPYVNGEAP